MLRTEVDCDEGPHPGALTEENLAVVRVSAVDRSMYKILDADGEWPARLSGRFIHHTEETESFPCVGDWVAVENGEQRIIHCVLPRKSLLRRKYAGPRNDGQTIAANIDLALLVQSVSLDFNLRRLDRYVVMAMEAGIQPVVILTKADLVSAEELRERLEEVTRTGVISRAIAVSARTGLGMEQLRALLVPGVACCVLGSSGVGKTSLINHLAGRELLVTGELSGTGEGTHTTRRRQLVPLEGGAMIVDTPGMRELGIVDTGEGVALGFQDIEELAAQCRYSNCHHGEEEGCAIRAAIESEELTEERLLSYFKLQRESSRLERLQRFRQRSSTKPGKYTKKSRKALNTHDEND